MNDKKFELSPYYKQRDLDAEKIPFNQRLPKPIVNDLKQFFKDNQWNQTDGMTYLALHFLNNHCFERKEFLYDVVFVVTKDKDLTAADLTAIGYVDGYARLNDFKQLINYDERQKHLDSIPDDVYCPYLCTIPIMDSADYFKEYDYYFHSDEDGFDFFNKYDDFFHGIQANNLDDLFYTLGFKFADPNKKSMPMANGGNLHGLKILNLRLNNFLDVKSGGLYKYHVGWKYDDFHKGIGILQDKNDFYFITYTWHLVGLPFGNGIFIDYMDFHSKEDWFEIVMESTNSDLQDFICDLDDFNHLFVRDVRKDIEDIDNQIQELQKRKKEYQDIYDDLFADDCSNDEKTN